MEGSEDEDAGREEQVNKVQANTHQMNNQNDDQLDNQNDHQRDNQNDKEHDLRVIYSFEEQFKQLYERSSDPKRKEFLDDLFAFMDKRGTPVNRIPVMAKEVLDLYELYRLVVAYGGLVEVINKKIWREITRGLNLPSSITSAAFTLRSQYMKYLYPYECLKERLSTPEELQQAIDGNRRDGRRSAQRPDRIESPIASTSGNPGNSLVACDGSTDNGGPSNGTTSNGSTSNGSTSNGAASNVGPSNSVLSNVCPSNGGPSNGGPSIIGPPYRIIGPAPAPMITALSLVPRVINPVNIYTGASSSEEDNGPIQSLSLNSLLAVAETQTEALDLQVRPKINGHSGGMRNTISNPNTNSSSSSNSFSFNFVNDRMLVNGNPNGNGNIIKDNYNNNNGNYNGRDRIEYNTRINNNFIANGNQRESFQDISGIDSMAQHSSSSFSSTSTSASQIPGTIIFTDDEMLPSNAATPTSHIQIANGDGRNSIENSLLLNMEINDTVFTGILHAQPLN